MLIPTVIVNTNELSWQQLAVYVIDKACACAQIVAAAIFYIPCHPIHYPLDHNGLTQDVSECCSLNKSTHILSQPNRSIGADQIK